MVHPKRWEQKTPLTANTAAGGFVTSDKFDLVNGSKAFFINGASSIFMYEGDEDSWIQLPNSGIAGTFAVGSCGEFRGLSAPGGTFTQTATGGTTSTIITNRTIVRGCAGYRIRVVAGTGVGYDSTITSNTIGANAVITVPTHTVAFDNTTQFEIFGGSLWFFNAGTTAVGFSVYDRITNSWTARSVTGLPTAWGTDAVLVSTIGAQGSFATGTATAGGAATLTNSAKSWGTNMWANYQIRITAGTGIGQIRTIASNTGTVITVSSNWTVNPDNTSVYSIEGNRDNFYLLGNNAVTLYKFSVSGNTWSTLTPTAARAGAPGGGMTGNWIESVNGWDNETLVNLTQAGTLYRQNGRYIYSFRGGATSTLDVYDIAANTWVSNLTYGNQLETFTTGSGNADIDGVIYLSKEITGRYFKFDVDKNVLQSLSTNYQPNGAVLGGNKLFVLPFIESSTNTNMVYVHQIHHTSTAHTRLLLI